MGICRALPLAALVVAIPLAASAQFGGLPGTLPPGFRTRTPVCQQQAALRDEALKHSKAIEKAFKRDAFVQETCGLFKTFLLAEEQYVKSIEEHDQACGSVPYDLDRMRRNYVMAVQLGKKVCKAAVQSRERPTGDFWWLDKPNSWPRRW
jgi:hypothetical protein